MLCVFIYVYVIICSNEKINKVKKLQKLNLRLGFIIQICERYDNVTIFFRVFREYYFSNIPVVLI